MKRLCTLVLALWLIAAPALAQTFPPASQPRLSGIDVSAWQGRIDWQQVAASGVKIAILRATEGRDFVDPWFHTNYAGATSAGVEVGFYHFMTAETEEEAEAQAEFFAETVAGLQPSCRLVLDYGAAGKLSGEEMTRNATAETEEEAEAQAEFFAETVAGLQPSCRLVLDYGAAGKLSGEEMTRNALAFLRRAEERTGWGGMLYTDAWAAKAKYGAALTAYPLWVANYGVREPEANGKWATWAGFQYSDRGQVPGIAGHVDLDWFTREVYLDSAAPPSTPTVPPTPPPTPPTGNLQYIQVRRQETSDALAQRLGITGPRLRALNPEVDAQVFPGLVVRYPGMGKARGTVGGWHIVQPREDLGTVARHYGTTAAALRRLNGFHGEIQQGQWVRIPPVRPGVQGPPAHFAVQTTVAGMGAQLSRIASQYGLTEQQLRRWNGFAEGQQLYRGQLIHLAPAGAGSGGKLLQGYVINRGDTLSSIAARFQQSVAELYRMNNLKSPNVLAGAGSGGKLLQGYVINRGDTLSSIAARFQQSVAELYRMNNLKSPNVLWPGQVLLIP